MHGQPSRAFGGTVSVETSACYDFVVSLRALFNPRTFVKQRRWAAAQLPRLPEGVRTQGRFLFGGFDTALGYGAARLIPGLLDPNPAGLVAAVRAADPVELATHMLDTGETSPERKSQFDAVLLEGGSVEQALAGLAPGWATRCRRVLVDPAGVQRDLADVLEAHLEVVYGEHLETVTRLLAEAHPAAVRLLDVLSPEAAIEQLTGGYTFAADLGLRRITLAPSVFIDPFMSTRVDENSGDALVIYPIASDIFDGYEPVPARAELVVSLKAIADDSRLSMLRLLANRPMYTADLVEQLRLAQPTVHHHLTQLRTARLIRQERDRHGMKYSLRPDAAAALLKALEDWISADPAPGPRQKEEQQ